MKRVIKCGLSFVIIFIILCLNRCSTHTGKEYIVEQEFPLKDLNKLMWHELKENRIVYIGDGWHGHSAYYGLVTGFLNYWLKQLETCKQNAPCKLVLFLEHDSVTQQLYDHFFSTGDLIPFFSTEYERLPGNWNFATTGLMEFLTELKFIKDRVCRITAESTSDIELTILGAEGVPPYRLEECTPQEFERLRDDYFINERDEISYQNIKDFLNANPDYKALIFYGTAHLIRGKTVKSEWSSNKDEKRQGYFNVHYLDSYYGRNNVCVFTTHNRYGPKKNTIRKYKQKRETADYNVAIEPVPNYTCPLALIINKTTLKAEYEIFKKYSEDPDINKNDYRNIFFENFIGRFFNTYINRDESLISEIKKINIAFSKSEDPVSLMDDYLSIGEIMINEFDAVKNITEMDKWIVSEYTMYYPSYNFHLKEFLRSFPDYKTTLNEINLLEDYNNSPVQLLERELAYLANKKNELTEYLLVNLLWIATAEEKDKAINRLYQRTGMNYSTAKEWNDYWRKKSGNPN